MSDFIFTGNYCLSETASLYERAGSCYERGIPSLKGYTLVFKGWLAVMNGQILALNLWMDFCIIREPLVLKEESFAQEGLLLLIVPNGRWATESFAASV